MFNDGSWWTWLVIAGWVLVIYYLFAGLLDVNWLAGLIP